nr:zinc finger, CCHC-type [Tanacetum cinerariifolium]
MSWPFRVHKDIRSCPFKVVQAKGNGKANGKGKDKQVYIPKPKNPNPAIKEHPAKDDTCHHYKEVGHSKRNYPVYLAELLKKKKQVGSANKPSRGLAFLVVRPKRSQGLFGLVHVLIDSKTKRNHTLILVVTRDVIHTRIFKTMLTVTYVIGVSFRAKRSMFKRENLSGSNFNDWFRSPKMDLSVGLILNGLTRDFAGFVRNQNKHNMGKTIDKLHALLIEYEKGLL